MALKTEGRKFPAGPLVKNPPANAGYTSSIPGLVWKDSTCGRATKPACCNYWGPPTHPGSCVLRQEKPLQWEACVLQPESHPCLLLQQEKACTQQWRPSVAKKKYIKKKKKRKETLWVLDRRHNNSSFLEVTMRPYTGTSKWLELDRD